MKRISNFTAKLKAKVFFTTSHLFHTFGDINFNSTFTKLIRSYLVLAIVILGLSTITLYINFKKDMIRQISSVSEKLLVQTNYFSNYLVNWTTISGYHLYKDVDIFNLMYGKNLSYVDEAIGKKKLKDAVETIPLAHSIYIYNGVTQTFYSSISEPTALSNFYDKEVISLLQNRKQYVKAKLIPRKLSFTIDGLTYKNNVLTVIISDYPIENNLKDGALILNLDASEIHNSIKDITPKNSNVFIINNLENIISHSDAGMFMQNVSGERYIQKILSANQRSGYIIDVVHGKKSLITYVASERLNFTFISIMPYQYLLTDIRAMTQLSLIVFIILLVIGIVLAYLFSKQIYIPIDNITKNVQKYFSAQKEFSMNKRQNELEFISCVIDKLMKDSTSLKNLSQVDINFLKQQLLKGLLLNPSNHTKDLAAKFAELNINIAVENLTVYVLRIDSYKDFCSKYSKENRNLLRFAICNIASEITSRHFPCDAVDMSNDHVAVILNIDHCPESKEIFISAVGEVQNTISQYLELSVTVGIGDPIQELKDISFCYSHAYEYTHYRFKYGRKMVLYREKIESDINEDYHYPEEKETSLFNALKLGHPEQVEQALSEMLEVITHYSYNDMLLAITQLTVNSKKLLRKLYDLDDKSLYMDIKSFRKNIQKFEDISEVKEWLLNLYRTTIQQREEKRCNRKEDLVNNVIRYITYHFSDPALSPELIADFVNISPNYLRSIFKEITGNSLSVYINEYRLNKAKELLEATNMTVTEIASSIGFSNDTYFYTAFKKCYGTTPSQYRKHVLKEKQGLN